MEETITFDSAKELKKATRTGFGFKTPNFSLLDIKSINGYEIKTLSPDVTNSNVIVYDVDTQSNKHFTAPFKIVLKKPKSK